MTVVSWGWQGTIDELQWARMSTLLGNAYAVDAPASCLPTAVAGARTVNVATGTVFGKGVSTQVTAAERPVIPTPAAGQWNLLVLRRTWAAKTAVFTVLPHTTTTDVVPAATATPTTYPAAYASSVGVTDDIPVAWVWASATVTTLVVVSLLEQTADRRASHSVGSVAERTLMHPGTPAQGTEVFRNDKGWQERYYALRSVANPGGAAVADWYPYAGRLPWANLTKSAAQSTGTAGAATIVTFNADDSSDGLWTAANPGRIYPNVRGLWAVSGKARLGDSSAYTAYGQVSMNGGTASRSEDLANSPAGAYIAPSDFFVVATPGTDYFELRAFSLQATTPIVPGNTLLSARYLGPA